MTLMERIALIGATGVLTYPDGLGHRVTIRDSRSSYGTERVQVEAVNGRRAWVDLDRVTLDKGGEGR